MTHDERVYHHLYETLEGIAEQSERIASLEELVLDVEQYEWHGCNGCRFADVCDADILYSDDCLMQQHIRGEKSRLGIRE